MQPEFDTNYTGIFSISFIFFDVDVFHFLNLKNKNVYTLTLTFLTYAFVTTCRFITLMNERGSKFNHEQRPVLKKFI